MMLAAFGVIRQPVVDVMASLLVGRILPIVPENSAEAKKSSKNPVAGTEELENRGKNR